VAGAWHLALRHGWGNSTFAGFGLGGVRLIDPIRFNFWRPPIAARWLDGKVQTTTISRRFLSGLA
jgi:hypothetical protein